MPRSLYIPSSGGDSGCNTGYHHFSCRLCMGIQLVYCNSTTRRNSAPEIFTSNTEVFSERDVLKVVSPDQKRAFCSGATKEVVTGSLYGKLNIVFCCKTNASLEIP